MTRNDLAPSEAAPPETQPTIAPELPPAALQQATAAVAPPPAGPRIAAAPAPAAFGEAWTTLAETQAAMARGLEDAAIEVTGMARLAIAAGTDAAIALLAARTLIDIVEINAGLARRSVDAAVANSARLSEIGVKAVAETSRPMLSRLGTTWGRAVAG